MRIWATLLRQSRAMQREHQHAHMLAALDARSINVSPPVLDSSTWSLYSQPLGSGYPWKDWRRWHQGAMPVGEKRGAARQQGAYGGALQMKRLLNKVLDVRHARVAHERRQALGVAVFQHCGKGGNGRHDVEDAGGGLNVRRRRAKEGPCFA